MNAKFKKVSSIVLNVFLWAFLVFAVIMTTLAVAAQSNEVGVPAIGGKCFLNVRSDSMKPQFKKGDMIIGIMLTDQEKENLSEQQVISFFADLDGDGAEEINTHRIIGINLDSVGNVASYNTKGDNWYDSGEVVACKDIISRWDGGKIVGLGFMIGALQNPVIFLCVIVLPILVLFGYEIFVFVRAVLSVKNSGKRQITAAEEELIKQRAVEEYLRAQAEKKAAEEQTTSTPES